VVWATPLSVPGGAGADDGDQRVEAGEGRPGLGVGALDGALVPTGDLHVHRVGGDAAGGGDVEAAVHQLHDGELERVGTATAGQAIETFVAEQNVFTGAAFEHVVAKTAEQRVIAFETAQHVIAAHTLKDIVDGVTVNEVAARTAGRKPPVNRRVRKLGRGTVRVLPLGIKSSVSGLILPSVDGNSDPCPDPEAYVSVSRNSLIHFSLTP